MAVFKRNPKKDDDLRCPSCHERIPSGASECAMCGRTLVAERAGEPQRRDSEVERPRAG